MLDLPQPWHIIVLLLYFVPIVVAAVRKCRAVLAISMVNIFLGWTFIGWVIALVWAAAGATDGLRQTPTPPVVPLPQSVPAATDPLPGPTALPPAQPRPALSPFIKFLLAVGCFVLIAWFVQAFIGRQKDFASRATHQPSAASSQSPSPDAQTTATQTSDAPAAAPDAKESWNYSEIADQMTGKLTTLACLDSEDKLDFGFPYNGGSTGTICLRKRRGRNDAYFKIDNGQIVCDVEGCSARLRVDGGQTFTASATEANDGDSKFIFFDSYSRILAIAKKAKEIKVEVLYYQEGPRVLTFEPSEPLRSSW